MSKGYCLMPVFLDRVWIKSLGLSLTVVWAIGFTFSASSAAEKVKPKPILLAPSKPEAAAPQSLPAGDLNWGQPRVHQYRSGLGRFRAGSVPSILGTSIQIDQLQAADPDSVGVLSVEGGGLGSAMWQGTARALIDLLLPMLPVKSPSPALRGLMLRLLLTPGSVPMATADSPNFSVLRVHLLMQMAEYAEAGQMLNLIPRQIRSAALLQTDVDRLMLSGETAEACAVVAREVQTDVAAYWQRALVYCQILAGEMNKARLGLSLLREIGVSETMFFSLAEAVIRKAPVTVEDPHSLTALQLVMAIAGNAEFSDSISNSTDARLLKALLTDSSFTLAQKFEAIERAAEIGLLRGDGLRQVYAEEVDGLKKLDAEVVVVKTALQRAFLYQAAARVPVPTAKAEAIAQAFRSARKDGRFSGVARLFHPLLAGIPRSHDLLWFAPDAMLASAAAADADSAGAWFQQIRTSALIQITSRPILAAVTPLARIMKLAGADNAQKISQAAVPLSEPALAPAPAVALVQEPTVNLGVSALLAGLGDRVAQTAWWPTVGGGGRVKITFPNPGLWLRMVQINSVLPEISQPKDLGTPSDSPLVAASAGVFQAKLASPLAGQTGSLKYADRVGERVLLALLVIGEQGLDEISPVILYEVLSGLRLAGLENVARALAVEVMLTSRLQ